ncbi:MAG: 50S ribosomal protein L4 [Deltaproteobacteria bacterium]|nr:MAG: 50S ribosomal protein L4 [Deltaproteobacteria bacterium]RLB02782.1 MAG: 50S ribosomal protein L4 [Deltaproteobacteria bacterium]
MATADLYNLQREKVGEVELRDEIFQAPVKPHLFYEVVKWQLAKRRRGTACTKTRAEVSGGGRKPWRQKGTGRARVGSIRSPLWRGGGVIFGPKPRDYSYPLPKKVRKAALKAALSLRFKEGRVLVLDSFELPEMKTKRFIEAMERLGLKGEKVLIVIDGKDEVLERSARNVPWAKVLRCEGLNVFDVLYHPNLLIVLPALQRIEERLLS